MSFLKTWAPYFKSNVRMRGRAIQDGGHVKVVAAQAGEIARAEVRGSQVYMVTIRDEGNTAAVGCTCRHFVGGRYCKHIWATLLALKYYSGDLSSVEELLEQASPQPPKARRRSGGAPRVDEGEPKWMGRLALLRSAGLGVRAGEMPVLAQPMQVCYMIATELSARHGDLVVQLRQRAAGAGDRRQPKPLKINAASVAGLADGTDRQLCAILLGGAWVSDRGSVERYADERAQSNFGVRAGAWRSLLRQMIGTGRCFMDSDTGGARALSWDDGGDAGGSWRLWLKGASGEEGLQVTVELRRGGRRLPIHQPQLVLGGPDGVIVCDGVAAPFDDGDAPRWVSQFRDDARFRRDESPIKVAPAEVEDFLDRLYALEQLPHLDLPEGIGRQAVDIEPVGHIELHSPTSTGSAEQDDTAPASNGRGKLSAKVWFSYGQQRVSPSHSGGFVSAPAAAAGDGQPRDAHPGAATAAILIRRDLRSERQALAQLAVLGFRPHPSNVADTLVLPLKRMPTVVGELLRQRWRVTADNSAIRRPGPTRLSIASGIDWFELRGSVRYETDGGVYEVPLPRILGAARSGKNMIELDDGTSGLLPEQWLEEHGLLSAIGELEEDHLRFKASQGALLDVLLKKQELIQVDDRFERMRQRLHGFERIAPIAPAPTFQGTLRPYQKDALGWFEFLRTFGIGGILADDMGLGKTVQVLAMLDAWYGQPPAGAAAGSADPQAGPGPDELQQPARPHRPTLIVVPRSVVFNWIDEAARFAPRLRIQAYAGTERNLLRSAFDAHDVIIASYGLMRRDIEDLHEYRFAHVVLDEAQMIKNPNSQSAKAARLLQADCRLALTGTPIENHIGDLWSIFEFLNPGMLGTNTRFAQLVRNGSGRARLSLDDAAADADADADVANLSPAAQASYRISQALGPFILRRTKKQVLDDLPEKTEQTILCQMEGEQQQVYDQLRQHYRSTLLRQAGGARGRGLGGGSTMMVLEALLRLRQAACHPGLIDPARVNEPSAKLEALLDSLTELIDEGHKALVFSQFTSMLALVRDRLEKIDIPYAYLDGSTTNRRQIVEQFQNDPKCPVFLISLKAGGLGLNLTAAEYVFILDPWWNPAVEQQAIDRAHRIGQTRHVFAYRMICQDTIEQRIAELQEKKKQLAEAIVGGEGRLLSNLSREDLERLLS